METSEAENLSENKNVLKDSEVLPCSIKTVNDGNYPSNEDFIKNKTPTKDITDKLFIENLAEKTVEKMLEYIYTGGVKDLHLCCRDLVQCCTTYQVIINTTARGTI